MEDMFARVLGKKPFLNFYFRGNCKMIDNCQIFLF